MCGPFFLAAIQFRKRSVEPSPRRTPMRRAHSLILAVAVCLPLAGCYYDPGYGYVRNGTGADVYYGQETTTVVSPGHGYYDYGPGCCYSGIGVGTVWYDGGYDRRYYNRGNYDRRYYDRNRNWHGNSPPRGGDWRGRDNDHRPGGWQGNNRPGNWQGRGRPGGNDGDHGDRRGNWQGGNRPQRGNSQGDNRPQGGWRGGGDHRPQSSATPRAAPTVRQAGTGRDRSRFRSGTD